MATLQRFKLLATQCATAASSPSRSPTPAVADAAARKSPSFHLRRPKTLKNLLTRSSSRRSMRRREPAGPNQMADRGERKRLLSHTSLKDLFVSSPPPLEDRAGGGGAAGTDCSVGRDSGYGLARRFGLEGFGGMFGGRLGFGAGRFGSTGILRYRLLRRAWRPVLVTIPE